SMAGRQSDYSPKTTPTIAITWKARKKAFTRQQPRRSRRYNRCIATGVRLMSEPRFLDIETKPASQEDLVAALNCTVSDQRRKSDELEGACRKLVDRVVEIGGEVAALRIVDAPPPHY